MFVMAGWAAKLGEGSGDLWSTTFEHTKGDSNKITQTEKDSHVSGFNWTAIMVILLTTRPSLNNKLLQPKHMRNQTQPSKQTMKIVCNYSVRSINCQFPPNQLSSTLYKVTWLFTIANKFPYWVSVTNLVTKKKGQLGTLQRRFSAQTKICMGGYYVQIFDQDYIKLKHIHLLKLQLVDRVLRKATITLSIGTRTLGILPQQEWQPPAGGT